MNIDKYLIKILDLTRLFKYIIYLLIGFAFFYYSYKTLSGAITCEGGDTSIYVRAGTSMKLDNSSSLFKEKLLTETFPITHSYIAYLVREAVNIFNASLSMQETLIIITTAFYLICAILAINFLKASGNLTVFIFVLSYLSCPYYIRYGIHTNSEPYALTFLLLAILPLQKKSSELYSYKTMTIMGLWVLLSTTFRSEILLFIPLFVTIILSRSTNKKDSFKKILLFFIIASLFFIAKQTYLLGINHKGITYLNWANTLDNSVLTLTQRISFLPQYYGSIQSYFSWAAFHYVFLLLGCFGLFLKESRITSAFYVYSLGLIIGLFLSSKIDYNIRYLYISHFFCLLAICQLLPIAFRKIKNIHSNTLYPKLYKTSLVILVLLISTIGYTDAYKRLLNRNSQSIKDATVWLQQNIQPGTSPHFGFLLWKGVYFQQELQEQIFPDTMYAFFNKRQGIVNVPQEIKNNKVKYEEWSAHIDILKNNPKFLILPNDQMIKEIKNLGHTGRRRGALAITQYLEPINNNQYQFNSPYYSKTFNFVERFGNDRIKILEMTIPNNIIKNFESIIYNGKFLVWNHPIDNLPVGWFMHPKNSGHTIPHPKGGIIIQDHTNEQTIIFQKYFFPKDLNKKNKIFVLKIESYPNKKGNSLLTLQFLNKQSLTSSFSKFPINPNIDSQIYKIPIKEDSVLAIIGIRVKNGSSLELKSITSDIIFFKK